MGGTIGKKFYVVGGRGSYSNVLEVYDPATNTWSRKASMGSGRSNAAATMFAAKLYVIGGWRWNADDSFDGVTTTSVYDPVTNTWQNKTPAPHPVGDAAGRVVVNGQVRIEVVGGARPGSNMQYVP